MFFMFTPWVEFEKEDVPASPDYANLHPTTSRSPFQWNENPMEVGATDQAGCLVRWSTFTEATNPEKFLKQAVWPQESGYHSVSGAFVCVNPVSWLLDEQVPSSIGAQAYELNRDSKSRLGASKWFSRWMMWMPDLSRAATINSMTFRSFITISRTTSGRGGTRSLTRIKGYRRHG